MRRRTLTLLVLVGCAAAALFPAAVATPAAPPYTAMLEPTVQYLKGVQNQDGGFPSAPGGKSVLMFSAWVTMALAAAGINPQDQAQPGGVDAYTYLLQRAGELKPPTTEYERTMLAVIATGTSPRDFGGLDLAALVLAQQLPEGGFRYQPGDKGGSVNTTVFAILPLSTVAGDEMRQANQRAVDWLLTVQSKDGGWPIYPKGQSNTDITASVIEALHAAGRSGTAAETRAWEFIDSRQGPGGGYGQGPGPIDENTASTAWVAQAMWAAGIDPATRRSKAGNSPLDYLAKMQQPDGSIKWMEGDSPGANANPVWMTAYALPAFTGNPLPIRAVPRAVTVEQPAESPDGVTGAAGGGSGAPLFTRPQGQSDGAAAGGVRRVANATKKKDEAEKQKAERKQAKAKPVTQTRRSPNGKTSATGTAQSNGVADSGVTPVASTATVQGGTDTEQPTDPKPRGKDRGDGGGEGEVTGRLLGRAPAGVSGRGKDQGFAPGLRSRTPDEGSPTTAIVLSILLAAAALAGARLEGQPGRGALPA